MTSRTSVAMTVETNRGLREHLLRDDGQEDICLATYSPSTGPSRRTALVRTLILPLPGEREVHGNASITGEYVMRAAAVAHQRGDGLVLCHSHPGGNGWQGMSKPDRDAESSFANLVRELTGMPLVGMTLAGRDGHWSARHWDRGVGAGIDCTASESVRVLGDHYRVSWNDELIAPPTPRPGNIRSVACWGPNRHADLTRRSVLVVGLGSVGLDVALRLAATGVASIGLMDFDSVEEHNLDRLLGVTTTDAWLQRSKVHVARRLLMANATAAEPRISAWEHSICEPQGLAVALDFDLVICCVDRPWPRAVLNALAYRDLIPVIDGGIAIDVFPDGEGMRNATWRSHVLRPGRPCMSCNGQLDLSAVAADANGTLDDPAYIAGLGADSAAVAGQNVATLSISAAAGLLAQYVSLNIAPGGIGEPGPLQYLLSTHTLEHLAPSTRPNCPVEALTGIGDAGLRLTADHGVAEVQRRDREPARLPLPTRIGRVIDDVTWKARAQLARHGRRRLSRGNQGPRTGTTRD